MKPNILFLVIDSLRADKCYGKSKTSATPNIDFLIENGAFFNQAICSVAATIPSISSIFSACHPFKIGMGNKSYQKFDSSIRNYIQILKENSYNVYATAPNVASEFGLVSDFINKDSTYDNYYSLFAGLGNKIIEKLHSKLFHNPWFFYVHIFDLHAPVIVPTKFNNENFGKSQYERMVSAIDYWIGKILQEIDLASTLVVLTSDHGEYIPLVNTKEGEINLEPSLTEKHLWKIGNKIPKDLRPLKKKFGSILRNSRQKIKSSKINDLNLSNYEKRILLDSRMGSGHRLYDDLIRIPLLFAGWNIKPKSLFSQQVRAVDIFPTIAELVDISILENVDGVSLRPILNGTGYDEMPAYIESPPTIKSSNKVIGIRTSNYKYIKNTDLDNTELYDLHTDPLEENNISRSRRDVVKKMESILINIKTSESEVIKINEKEREKIENILKKLGYS